MKPSVIWVLTANSSYAEIFEIIGPHIQKIHHLDYEEGRKKVHDIVSDKQGSTFASMGGGVRHMLGDGKDIKHHEQNFFAHQLVELCAKAKEEKRFDRLSIVAEPRLLGEIRHVLAHHKLQVEKEVPKDLPEFFSDQEKIEHLQKYLDF